MVRYFARLKDKCLNLEGYCIKHVGNGLSTRFWLESWIGTSPLKDQFPRIFVLDPFPGALIVDRNSSEKFLDAFGRLPRTGVPNSQWVELCSVIQNYVFKGP